MAKVSDSYLQSLADHANECEADITHLRKRLDSGQWGRFDQLAAERALQVLIEGAIGAARHWAKFLTGFTSNEALAAFQRLEAEQAVPPGTPWRKMIGLRNVLVHDYLDVDPEIVKAVIREKHYRLPLSFIRQAVDALQQPD